MMHAEQSSTDHSSQDSTATRVLSPASNLEFKPGALIVERFKVIELLGSGGMGSVYKVEDIETNSIYALKFLHKQQTNDANWRRFDIEAKTSNKLDHPNLIKVYETGLLPDGQPFFTMDLVEGESLADILRTRGRLSVTQAIKIFIQVGFALSYAHENGVIHRDIKPSNIMLQRQSDDATIGAIVKVVDFGIAKLTGQDEFTQMTLTKTGEIFGSPLYMSPEQCMGIGVDHRSDLYSLGCVMYEALTGAPPLVGESALSTMMKHQNEEALTLKEASLGIDFPQQMERIVHGLLRKDAKDRYQSAKQFTADLVNFDAASDSTLPMIRSERQVAKVTSTSRKNLSMVFIYFVLLLAGTFVGLAIPRHQKQEPKLKDNLEFGILEFMATQSPTALKAGASTTNNADYEKSCDIQLGLLEKRPGYFSSIDKKNKLRIFEFPDFEVGLMGKLGGSRKPVRGTATYSLSDPVNFEPNYRFRKHPKLFEKLRDDDITSLILKNYASDVTVNAKFVATTDSTLQHIGHMKKLRELHMISTDPSPKGWELVNSLPDLNSLTLSHVQLSVAEVLKFKRLRNLVHFKIITNEKITPVLRALSGSKNLRNLCVVKCDVDDADARYLATYENLAHVELRSTKITDTAIDYLPASLVTLDVTGCKVTNAIVPKLAHLKNLREMKISSGILGKADLKRIQDMLPELDVRVLSPEDVSLRI